MTIARVLSCPAFISGEYSLERQTTSREEDHLKKWFAGREKSAWESTSREYSPEINARRESTLGTVKLLLESILTPVKLLLEMGFPCMTLCIILSRELSMIIDHRCSEISTLKLKKNQNH